MQGSQASTYHIRRVALDQLQPSIPARYYYDSQHYEWELEVKISLGSAWPRIVEARRFSFGISLSSSRGCAMSGG